LRRTGLGSGDDDPRASLIPVWRATGAGLCACLVGIGIGRFAYTPLIPALIAAGWFAPTDVLYLAAANLVGYLAGALLARRMARALPTLTVLRGAMVLATAACFACAVPLSLSWYFAWRLAAGLAGGIIMVLAAASILPHVPPARRGLAGGVVFTGIGLGIAASGTLVPLLLRHGLAETWQGLGLLSAVLTLVSWRSWPPSEGRAIAGSLPPTSPLRFAPVRVLALEYGLNAIVLAPHTIFLVDFVARGLNQGLTVGSGYWIAYGMGAMAGPLLAGFLADRAGFRTALRLAYLVQGAMVAVPLMTSTAPVLLASAVVLGACTPGIVPLAFGRLHELLPNDLPRRQVAWGQIATSYAVFQAIAAYGLSFLFTRTGSYLMLFAVGVSAAALALALDLLAGRRAPR
jgi:MFS family permease